LPSLAHPAPHGKKPQSVFILFFIVYAFRRSFRLPLPFFLLSLSIFLGEGERGRKERFSEREEMQRAYLGG